MNETEIAKLMIKGIISELPKDEQEKIMSCYENLKSVVAQNGDLGFIAFSLLATELQEETR